MISAETLGKGLKEYRKQRGMNQKQFAQKAQVKTATISKWENGERNPGLIKILELCQNLGVTVEQLFGLDDKKNYRYAKIFAPG